VVVRPAEAAAPAEKFLQAQWIQMHHYRALVGLGVMEQLPLQVCQEISTLDILPAHVPVRQQVVQVATFLEHLMVEVAAGELPMATILFKGPTVEMVQMLIVLEIVRMDLPAQMERLILAKAEAAVADQGVRTRRQALEEREETVVRESCFWNI
jgi:hypothetical protein